MPRQDLSDLPTELLRADAVRVERSLKDTRVTSWRANERTYCGSVISIDEEEELGQLLLRLTIDILDDIGRGREVDLRNGVRNLKDNHGRDGEQGHAQHLPVEVRRELPSIAVELPHVSIGQVAEDADDEQGDDHGKGQDGEVTTVLCVESVGRLASPIGDDG